MVDAGSNNVADERRLVGLFWWDGMDRVNSRSSLGDTTQSLSQVFASTNKRHLEGVLANVVLVVGHGEDLGFLGSTFVAWTL